MLKVGDASVRFTVFSLIARAINIVIINNKFTLNLEENSKRTKE